MIINSLAIIPARGGSKRIPKKNVRNFLGKPIIAYSIEAALDSKLFDEVMVSTDDAEIAEIAKSYGAAVPFFRSSKNSDDFATTSDVLIEVLEEYEKINRYFVNGCCIYATAPFVTAANLKTANEILIKERFDSVFPILRFSYPIQRALQMVDQKVTMINSQFLDTRSQDLPKAYHDSGQFYWFSVAAFKMKRRLFTDNSGSVVLSDYEAHDIDDLADWKIAELKYQYLHSKK